MCESNSVVECNLAKVKVEGSNPFFRLYVIIFIANIVLIGKWPAFQAGVMSSSLIIRIILCQSGGIGIRVRFRF